MRVLLISAVASMALVLCAVLPSPVCGAPSQFHHKTVLSPRVRPAPDPEAAAEEYRKSLLRGKYKFGPYEMIGDEIFGEKAKPTAEDNGMEIDTRQTEITKIAPPIEDSQRTTPAAVPTTLTKQPLHSSSVDHPVLPPTRVETDSAAHPPSSAGEPVNLADAHRSMTNEQILIELRRFADLLKQQTDARAAIGPAPNSKTDHTVIDAVRRAWDEANKELVQKRRHHLSHPHESIVPPKPAEENDPNQPTEFALKFHGECETNTTADNGNEVPWCKLKATSQELMTLVHPNTGVEMSVRKLFGAIAHAHLYDVQMTSESTFTTRGNVSFGSTRKRDHMLRFESAGEARVTKLKSGERQFTAQFGVTDGEGVFEGSKGTITMNGRLLSLMKVEAIVTGVIYKEPALAGRRRSYRINEQLAAKRHAEGERLAAEQKKTFHERLKRGGDETDTNEEVNSVHPRPRHGFPPTNALKP